MIRPARPDDANAIHRFIVELAETEAFPGEVSARPSDVHAALFGARPSAEAVVAEADGVPVGFALFYPTYSTIEGRPGIHLEDLYVGEAYRGSGLGHRFLEHLARLARDRGCARVEWWVLRTNEPAIKFYLGLGARLLDEIDVFRLDGNSLARNAGD
jgi:GNAT superfamily N-acetyltransferase